MTGAEHVRLALEELGPTFIKLGQILSTRPDILPPSYITELSRLQDQVPPSPWEDIKRRIEEELGDSIENLFLAFDPTPIAAASLAQVHGATLPDGRKAVVKVQRPGIERTIRLDLDILYELAQLAQDRTTFGQVYNLVDLVEEFGIALWGELDYRREGRNADRFRENFAKEQHLYVPEVFWTYTTDNVLVQERITGIKIDNVAALEAAGYDRHRLAEHSARLIIKEVLEDGFFHADPHPGNILVLPGEVIGLMDFGTVGYLDSGDRTNLIRLYIVAVQLDAAGIVDQLVRMGIADPTLDRVSLQRDLRRLLLRYRGVPLKETRIGDLIEEIRPIVYDYHLQVPTDLWLLGKTFVLMEGAGKLLDPDFDIFAFSEPYAKRFVRRLWLPSEWGPLVLQSANSWNDLLADFPRQTTRILSQLERNELGLRLSMTDLDRATHRFDRIANRAILAVLLAAGIVALAMMMPLFNPVWPWGLMTWIIMIGFIVMSVIALWLILLILRSGGG